MANLKIRTFKADEAQPETTITIPLGVLRVASKLIPKQAASALREKGVDVDQFIELSHKGDVQGTLVEIEDHRKNEKAIIAIE